MKKSILGACLSFLVVAPWAGAQTKYTELPAPPVSGAVLGQSPTQAWTDPGTIIYEEYLDAAAPRTPRFWVKGEYLLWWVKDAPINAPILQRGTVEDGSIDFATGQANYTNVTTLFGNEDRDYNGFSGGRVSLGYWFGPERRLGVEASYFQLERRSTFFNVASNGTDLANSLILPYTDAQTNSPGSVFIAVNAPLLNNVAAAGAFVASTSLRFWGADVNGVYNLRRTNRFNLDVIGGIKYYDLKESLAFDTSRRDFSPTTGLPFDQNRFTSESFNTRNEFLGGQVGARAEYSYGRLSLGAVGMVALGTNRQTINIQGNTTQVGADPTLFIPASSPGVFPGFVFTQPSNIGTHSRNEFAAIPSLQLTLGYQMTERLRATVGYDFIYWGEVVRPGNQIDPVVNTSQNPALNNTGFTGPARPGVPFTQSDFFAHGLNFGLEFRY